MAIIPTSKLSIYLIKDEYTEPQDLFKELETLTSEEIDDVGVFYYGNSSIYPPTWIKKFFGSTYNNVLEADSNKLKIFNASSKAVFVVSTEEKTFVISFGYGHTLLNPGVWEEGFGLKTVLNIVDPESIRRIDKKNMAAIPKLSIEQIARDGTAADFGLTKIFYF